MDCPVCKVPLIVVERNGIEVDYCISCRGIWFDEGEIELLSEKININIEHIDFNKCSTAIEKLRTCPRCDKTMDKVTIGNNSGFLIDKCPDDHGIWLDSGELSKASSLSSDEQSSDKSELVNFLGEIIKISI